MGSTQSSHETQDAIRDVAHNPSSVTQQDLADWDALVQSFENPTPREVKKRKDPTLVTGYTVEDLHAFDCLAAALEGDVGGEATEEDFRPTRVFDEDDSFGNVLGLRAWQERASYGVRTAMNLPGAVASRALGALPFSSSSKDVEEEVKEEEDDDVESGLAKDKFVGRRGHAFTNLELTVLSNFSKNVDHIDLDQAAEVFDILDDDGDGTIALTELRNAAEDPRIIKFVEDSKCQMLRALLLRDGVEPARARRVLRAVDADRSGSLDREEWAVFVTALARERVRYLKVIGLCQRRCFWGRGAEELREEGRGWLARFYSCVIWYETPPGYVEDFAYYSRNYHPVLALFYRDLDHPLNRLEKTAMLFTLTAYCLLATTLVMREKDLHCPDINKDDDYYPEYPPCYWRDPHLEHDWKGMFWNFVFVTLPSTFGDILLFYMLACPCIQFENQGRKQERKWRRLESVLTGGGHLIVLPLFVIGAFFVVAALVTLFWDKDTCEQRLKDGCVVDDPEHVLSFIYSFLISQLLWPLKILAKEFNLAIGKYHSYGWYRMFFCKKCGFGRWGAERADALKAKSGDNAVAQVAQASTGGRLGAFWPRTKTNAREGRGATAHRGFPR